MRGIDTLPNTPGVYLIRNTANGKIYVGSSRRLRARLRIHIGELARGEHHSRHLQSAWCLYGESAFEVEMLEHLDTDDTTTLEEAEQYWLDALQPWDRTVGYNVARKATAGPGRFSEESRQRMREAKQGRKLDPEHVAKIAAANRGRTPSQEELEKLRRGREEWIHRRKEDPEAREIMQQAREKCRGRRHTEAAKEKLRAAHLGVKKPDGFGDTMRQVALSRSEEVLAKIALSNSGTYRVTDPAGNSSVIQNLSKFCRDNGLSQSAMWRVSKGRGRQHKGWICQVTTAAEAAWLAPGRQQAPFHGSHIRHNRPPDRSARASSLAGGPSLKESLPPGFTSCGGVRHDNLRREPSRHRAGTYALCAERCPPGGLRAFAHNKFTGLAALCQGKEECGFLHGR